MDKMTMGMIAGGLMGAAGAAWAFSDRKSRKRLAKDTKRIVQKASELM